jgi:hypothetical protein
VWAIASGVRTGVGDGIPTGVGADLGAIPTPSASRITS